jgi:hypothetical protein
MDEFDNLKIFSTIISLQFTHNTSRLNKYRRVMQRLAIAMSSANHVNNGTASLNRSGIGTAQLTQEGSLKWDQHHLQQGVEDD